MARLDDDKRSGNGVHRMLSILALCLASALALGCSDDEGDERVDGGGTGEPDGGDGDGDQAVETVMLTVKLAGAVREGFEFCNTDEKELGCATSDDTGEVTIEVPADSDVALTVDHDDFAPLLFLYQTTDSDAVSTQVFPFYTAGAPANHEDVLDIELQTDKGAAIAYAVGSAGGTATISPEAGQAYYWAAGNPLPEAAALVGGTVAWYNAEPGDYEVTFDVPDRNCVAVAGAWARDEPNTVGTRVMADRWTWGSFMDCSGEPTHVTVGEAYPDATSCEDGLSETVGEACAACSCAKCLDAINACGAAAGCIDIVECAADHDCSGDACYQAGTCRAVIDGTPGGLLGTATPASTAWGGCVQAECATECEE